LLVYISNAFLSENANCVMSKEILFSAKFTCVSGESIVGISVVSSFGFRVWMNRSGVSKHYSKPLLKQDSKSIPW
jgi:hypothetical protein